MEKTPFDFAAFYLSDAARYLHQCRALHEVGHRDYATYKACATTALDSAAKSLGFSLVPLTEQKEAA